MNRKAMKATALVLSSAMVLGSVGCNKQNNARQTKTEDLQSHSRQLISKEAHSQAVMPMKLLQRWRTIQIHM